MVVRSDADFSIQVEQVRSSYGQNSVLRSISLSVAYGETFSLLGPSGSGKTTLLRVIAGLHIPDSGIVTLGGKVVFNEKISVAPEARRVGMVFQDGALFPHLKVAENIAFGLSKSVEKDDRIQEVLELVGMASFAERYPDSLSGGQQQRVALARALAPKPKILLLDEPFSALDTELRVSLRSEIKQILKEVGCTSILVTHDQDEAFLLGDRVAVMDAGEIKQIGSPSDIYENPADPWVASFVGESNLLKAVIVDDEAKTFLGRLPLSKRLSAELTGEKQDVLSLTVAVRPEHLELLSDGSGKIMERQYFGHDVLYKVRFDDAQITDLAVRSVRNNFVVGDHVGVKFIGDAVTGWFD